MIMYESPIWAGSVTPKSDKIIRRVQRKLATKVVWGYRTISHDIALALAGMVPFGILAAADAKEYKQIQALRGSVGSLTRVEKTQIRKKEQQNARNRWKQILFNKKSNNRVIAAVLAHWDQWLDRGAGTFTYRVTQIITGHGCFGEYLHRIGTEQTPACQECDAKVDSAQHVLEVCRFQEQRQVLKDTGNDTSLTDIVGVLVEEESGRMAIIRFCEEVMATKEITERSRETCDPARRERRRAKVKTGRRARSNTLPT